MTSTSFLIHLGPFVGGAALSFALSRLPLLGGEDPLRSTLVLLPWIAAALLSIGRQIEDRGGRRRLTRPTSVEGAGLLLLTIAALGRGSLGLRYPHLTAHLIFAGLCLLLGWRVVQLLRALRPTLGSELPRRPSWIFFFLPLTVYLAILPWSTEQRPPDGDEPYYLLITHSLAYDFDEGLGNNYRDNDSLNFLERRLVPQPGDPVTAEGEAYSRHNLLLPLVLAPAYRLAGKLGALAVMALLTAALCRESLRLATRYRAEGGAPGPALAAWSVFAFTAPLLLYSHQVWIEVPATLLTVVAIERIHRLREGEGRRGMTLLVLCASLVLLPLLKLRLVVVGGGLTLLLLLRTWRRRNRRLVIVAAGGFALAIAAVLLVNQMLFGAPLRYYRLGPILAAYQTSPLNYFRGLAGMFLDCAFGLAAFTPIWLLAPIGLVRTLRRPRLLVDLTLALGPYLILFGPRTEFYGGWSPPLRYGMVALPVAALLLERALASPLRLGGRVVTGALVGLTAVLTPIWLALPGWTYNFADGRSHLLDFLSRLLDHDVARLFPSYVRLRPASWIWPAVVAAALALWWLGRHVRPAAARAGVAALLATAALLPAAATELPTRVVEFEDPYVEKRGGTLYPHQWVNSRPRFRGGWRAAAGTRLTARIVPGGAALTIGLDVWRQGGAAPELLILEGESARAQARLDLEPGWTRVEMGPFAWGGGDQLVFEISVEDESGSGYLLLDRARLSWGEAPGPERP